MVPAAKSLLEFNNQYVNEFISMSISLHYGVGVNMCAILRHYCQAETDTDIVPLVAVQSLNYWLCHNVDHCSCDWKIAGCRDIMGTLITQNYTFQSTPAMLCELILGEVGLKAVCLLLREQPGVSYRDQ